MKKKGEEDLKKSVLDGESRKPESEAGESSSAPVRGSRLSQLLSSWRSERSKPEPDIPSNTG